MTALKTMFAALAMMMLFGSANCAMADERAELRLALQASMQRHIDRNMIDDAFVSIDFESGSLVEFVPTKAHTHILEGEGFFVLCSDMRNSEGKSVPVDYYMARAGRGYRVFRTEIGNRAPLKAMMKAGKVSKL